MFEDTVYTDQRFDKERKKKKGKEKEKHPKINKEENLTQRLSL
jgi:hypothetical protein